MKQRPILFSAPMVRALLDGSKTQTRRILKPQPEIVVANEPFIGTNDDGKHGRLGKAIKCPFGDIGDQLWVRETWQYYDWTEDGMPCIRFAADNQTMWAENADQSAVTQWEILSEPENYNIDNRARDRKWRPSIFMYRWASRITLEITSVRVERLQDISEEDAKAEGVMQIGNPDLERPDERDFKLCPQCGGTGLYTYHCENGAHPDTDCTKCDSHKKLFKNLWESINGAESWEANPWVWCVSFRKVEQ